MRTSRTIFGLSLLVPIAGIASAQAWEHYPGLSDPGRAGILVGDHDGDGRPEALITGTSSAGTLVGVVAADASGALQVRSMTLLPFHVSGQIVAAPPEEGAARFAALVRNSFELGLDQVAILGDLPPRVLRMITVPYSNRIAAIADVDGDSHAELVLEAAPTEFPLVVDYETGTLRWSLPGYGHVLGAAQLDDDQALELVLGNSHGVPGRVVDGASQLPKWTYTPGFRGRLAAGRFLSDPSLRTFAVGEYNLLQVFRSGPWSPVLEFPILDRVAGLATVVLEPGGRDHIAVGTVDAGRVDVYDPRTGTRVRSLGDAVDSSHQPGVWSIAIGDLVGEGGDQVAFSTGLGHSGKRQVRIHDLATGMARFVQEAEQGPYAAVARGPVAGSGRDEVVYVTSMSDQASDTLDGQMLRVLNADDGRVLRERSLSTSSGFSHVALAQLDGDPQLEIVVVSGSYSEIAVIDGVTLRDQWRLRSADLDQVHMSDLAMIDVDGDGTEDIVTLGRSNVHVFNGRNGNRIGQPLPVTGFGRHSLAVFHQTTGKPTAIVATADGLYVFDLRSRALIVQRAISAEVTGLTRWGDRETCKVGVASEDGLAVHRCANLALEHTRPMPWGTAFFRPLDAAGSHFIAAANDWTSRVYEIGPGGQAAPLSGVLGGGLGVGNLGILNVDPDARYVDVLLGSDFMVTRKRLELELLFADNFD